jgi:hypothetical protein
MICLAVGAVIVPLMSDRITLAWMHSVEKVPWEEEWQATPAGLEILEARVKGSGAGMEPPPDARLVHGAWAWKPKVPPQAEVIMRRSGATADWRICIAGQCRPMAAYVPPQADPIVMKVCDGP